MGRRRNWARLPAETLKSATETQRHRENGTKQEQRFGKLRRISTQTAVNS
jgi:hypothetical protein